MRDPNFYDDVDVLRNLLNIKYDKQLETTESNITYVKLLDIDRLAANVDFDVEYLKQLHHYIFSDIYEWAGKFRTIPMVKCERVLGDDTVRYSLPDDIEKDLIKTISDLKSVEWNTFSIDEAAKIYAEKIAALWQVHPFREGKQERLLHSLRNLLMLIDLIWINNC